MRKFVLTLLFFSIFAIGSSCRRRADVNTVTVALPEKFTTLDTLTTTSSDASAERVKTLIFNSLVKKDENFEYVGDLATSITPSADGLKITFILRDGVKFHNGKDFTSADVKYTYDQLFASNGYKAGAFFDTVPDTAAKPAASAAANTAPAANGNSSAKAAEAKTKRVPHITSIETPDPKTIVFAIARPSLRSLFLSNMVAIPIIPEGSVSQQKDNPIGTGPFKFVSFDGSQSILDLTANEQYFDGPPKVAKLRVKTVTDATSLQAELQTGGVDIAPNPSNLPPDMLKAMGSSGSLRVDQFEGSNLQYLIFNVLSAPLDKVKVRQAIGYAVDRDRIVKDLLSGQATVANATLPPQSWAFSSGHTYSYDPGKARQLLEEAGYKNEPINFRFGSGNAATSQYAQVIQSSLADVGLNVQIETLEANVIRQQLAQGQFQMYTGAWIGGNTDPIFMKNLFATSMIPGATVPCCNRGRYSNPEFDKTIEDAINATDKAQAKQLYAKSWDIVSNDLPLLPLWYPANIVVSNKRIGNVKMSGSGDWGFLKDITVAQQ
jgi:peptide/nickel transport system substrate-binding protein